MDINYWTEFLFKKVEQINRKDAITGMTNWAIIGVLGFLLNKVYNIFKEFNFIASAGKLICVLFILGIFVLLLYFTISVITNKNKMTDRNFMIPLNSSYSFELILFIAILYILLFMAMLKCIFILHIPSLFEYVTIVLFSIYPIVFLLLLLLIKLDIPIAINEILNWEQIQIEKLRKSKKFKGKLIYSLKKSINFIIHPAISSLFILYFFGQALINKKIINWPEDSNIFSLTIFIWEIIFLIAVLIVKRKSYFLVHSLENLQDKIVTGKLKDVDAIKEEYENIVVGQNLSRWFREYWILLIERNKELSEIFLLMKEHVKRCEELRVQAASKGEKCQAPCLEFEELEKLRDRLGLVGADVKKITKKMQQVYNLYRNTNIANELLNKINESLKALDETFKIGESINFTKR